MMMIKLGQHNFHHRPYKGMIFLEDPYNLVSLLEVSFQMMLAIIFSIFGHYPFANFCNERLLLELALL